MKNLKKAFLRWKEVIFITLIIKLFLFIISLSAANNQGNIFISWVNWDANAYLDIARDWYFGKNGLLVIVYYPMYPVIIKLFSIFIGSFEISAILASIIFSFIASVALFELCLLDFNKRVAILSVWFMNIFPASYFLQAPYTESLFLATSILTVYFFRKKLFAQAGFLGFLTTLTRINGLTLMPLLFIENKINKQNLITFLLLPLGFLVYLGINFFTFGDFFYFTKPLYEIWQKKLDWPWMGIYHLVGSDLSTNHAFFSEVITLAVVAFLGLYTFLKIRKSYGVYILVNLLLITSTSFILSTPRYVLVLFPIFITLGNIKSKKVIVTLSIMSIIFLYFFTFLYIHKKWAF